MDRTIWRRMCDVVERCSVSEWAWQDTTDEIGAEIRDAGYVLVERDALWKAIEVYWETKGAGLRVEIPAYAALVSLIGPDDAA